MQKGKNLVLKCLECKTELSFSIFELEQCGQLHCPHCEKVYVLQDPTLLRQLRKFEALCRQIRESEEILGQTSVGVDVGNQQVKIPYRLLLTRLNSELELKIGEVPLSILFRLEPISDYS